MRRGAGGGEPGWSVRDDALGVTAEIGLALHRDRLGERPGVPVPFPMAHSTGEVPHAFGPFRLLSFQVRGDGSYVHHSAFLLARGRGALPLMLGLGAATMTGNTGRRRRASALAQPQWVVLDTGTVTVSSHGFYLHTPTSLLPWNWDAVRLATLVAPGCLRLTGTSTDGPVEWVLESDWAELILLLWATVRNPGHEQLRRRTWLPEEWVTRALVHSSAPVGSPRARALRSTLSGLGFVHPAP